MNKSAQVALLLVGLMISSSFLVVSTTLQPARAVSTASSSLLPAVPGNNSNSTIFTAYVPRNTVSSAIMGMDLRSNGITPSIAGNLWTFSVPSGHGKHMGSLMDNLSSQFHTSYFTGRNHTLAFPMVQPMGAPQSGNIPFAYTPGLIKKAYNFTWALSHGINGKGQTIVIVDAFGDPNLAYDLKAFDSVNSLPKANITVEYPFGTPGEYNSTWAMETATDVEWAHALAPGARIVLLVSTSAYTNNLQQMVSYAVENGIGNILSLSWGTPESQLNKNIVDTYAQVYANAASKGIDVFAASGDNGAYSGTSHLTVSFPSSDPWVTGVGGTSLYVLGSQFHQYGWGGLNNGVSYGSGGGYSHFFSTPYWQNATGFKGTMRGAPDVAMDADKYTGVYVISDGGQYTVGGTSVSTPMWADVAALMRQYTNDVLPPINPLLYQIARSQYYTSSFSQIVSGTNGYYNNTPGWNPVTGLGTPLVSGLLNASRILLNGYGANVLFSGPENYNATSMTGSMDLTTVAGNLDHNGSTFYYLGFYGGNGSSVKFGVLQKSSGMQLFLKISQNGSSVARYFQMPSGYGPGLKGFLLGITYTGSSIDIHSSGGFQYSIPVFLDYSGSMVPFSGAQQIGSGTNLTRINNMQFTDLRTFNGTAWANVSQMYFEPFSYFSTPSFSTIGASFSNGALDFQSSGHQSSGYINGSQLVAPEIMYSINYGYPLEMSLSLPGIPSQINWTVNGSSLAGPTFRVPVAGGTFLVTASFRDSFGSMMTVNRTVPLPGMSLTNLSLNYSIAGLAVPRTTVTTMWFYSSTYSPGTLVPVLNATYSVGIGSVGFKRISTYLAPTASAHFNLVPEMVNATVFVFNGNSSVSLDGKNIPGNNGYFRTEVSPSANLTLNVSAPGFMDSNFTYSISPGMNFTHQVTLMPLNLNYSIISGTVTDYLYSFSLEGAMVSLYNSTSSYTNNTGYYTLFAGTGNYTVKANATLYNTFSAPLNVTSNKILNFQLKPSKITLHSTTPVNITHYFPLLFYFGFVSWDQYRGSNFSAYQVYVSKQPDFLNPTIKTIGKSGTSYTFLTGLVPGRTYYVSVVLQLSNSQVYQSQVVKVTYDNPVYLVINALLVGAIGLYAYMAFRIFRKKK